VIAVVTTWPQFASLWAGLLGEVWEAIRDGHVRAGRNVMLYRDERPSVEVGVEVHEAFEARGRVVPSTLPGGLAATTIAHGAPTVQGLADAHARVERWSSEHGHLLRGDRWERYSHHHDAAAMYTEIYWALRALR